MPVTKFSKNYMLDQAAANSARYASLHIEDPGENGANEIDGGEPRYARKPIKWNKSVDGVITASTQPVLDVPRGKTIKFIGFWDAESGGNFIACHPVTAETFGGQGNYTVLGAELKLG